MISLHYLQCPRTCSQLCKQWATLPAGGSIVVLMEDPSEVTWRVWLGLGCRCFYLLVSTVKTCIAGMACCMAWCGAESYCRTSQRHFLIKNNADLSCHHSRLTCWMPALWKLWPKPSGSQVSLRLSPNCWSSLFSYCSV